VIKFYKDWRKKIKKKGIDAILINKGEIKAVHDKDLVTFLKSIGEYDAVMNKRRKCFFCNDIITFDNILSIFPLNNKVQYCCKNPECYQSLMERKKINA